MRNFSKKVPARLIPYLLFIIAISFRLPGVIYPPESSGYNVDEFLLSASTLGLLANQTPSALQWPSATVMMPLLAVYTTDFIISKPDALSDFTHKKAYGVFESLSEYMAEFYLDPSRQIHLGRILVLLLGSLSIPFLYWFLYREQGSKILAITAALVLASSPFFAKMRFMVRGDAFATTFWILTLAILIGTFYTGRRKALLGGLFLGLTMAGKFIYIAFIPIGILALVLSRSKEDTGCLWKEVAVFLFAITLPLLIFIPFIWVYPITFAKSFFGLVIAREIGEGSSWIPLLMKALPSFVGWGGLIFCALGMVYSFTALKRTSAILLLLTMAVFIYPIGRASILYARWALPVLPLLCIYCALGIYSFSKITRHSLGMTLSVVLLIVIVSLNTLSIVEYSRRLSVRTNAMEAIDWLHANVKADSSMALPPKIAPQFVPDEASLKRALKEMEDSKRFFNRLPGLVAKAGLNKSDEASGFDTPITFHILGEDERRHIFGVKLKIWYLKRNKGKYRQYDIWVHGEGNDPYYFELKRETEMVSRFQRMEIEYLVNKRQMPDLKPYLIKSFTSLPGQKYFVYRKTQMPGETGVIY